MLITTKVSCNQKLALEDDSDKVVKGFASKLTLQDLEKLFRDQESDGI